MPIDELLAAIRELRKRIRLEDDNLRFVESLRTQLMAGDIDGLKQVYSQWAYLNVDAFEYVMSELYPICGVTLYEEFEAKFLVEQ